MKSHFLRGWWVVAFLITLGLCLSVPAAYATTSETEVVQEDEHDGPVFLILSLEDEFDTPTLGCTCDCCKCCKCKKCYKCCKCEKRCRGWCWKCWWFWKCRKCGKCDCGEKKGSGTYIVKIGTYIAGEEIGETRFEPESELESIELPGDLTFGDLDGYQITILGAFDTLSPETVHLVTPDPADPEAPIPPAVQEAFFLASPFLEQMPQFPEPTTVELAEFIFATAVEQNPALADETSAQEILNYIFVTPTTLDAPEVADVQRAVSSAKVTAGDSAIRNARTCIQVHGGMGFTWEVMAHYYLKRAWVLENAFGTQDEHADKIADILDALA